MAIPRQNEALLGPAISAGQRNAYDILRASCFAFLSLIQLLRMVGFCTFSRTFERVGSSAIETMPCRTTAVPWGGLGGKCQPANAVSLTSFSSLQQWE